MSQITLEHRLEDGKKKCTIMVCRLPSQFSLFKLTLAHTLTHTHLLELLVKLFSQVSLTCLSHT